MSFRQAGLAGGLTALLLAGAAQAQAPAGSGLQGAGTASSGASAAAGAPRRGSRRAARPTTADTSMNTSGSGVVSEPTGPETSTPDAQGTSDLSGSTGPSVPLGASPAPPSPAPPGGAPSGGEGPH